jgi:hypothetical protein
MKKTTLLKKMTLREAVRAYLEEEILDASAKVKAEADLALADQAADQGEAGAEEIDPVQQRLDLMNVTLNAIALKLGVEVGAEEAGTEEEKPVPTPTNEGRIPKKVHKLRVK